MNELQAAKNEIARLTKKNIELEQENTFLKGEIRGIGHRRTSNADATTTDKINIAFERRFAAWAWYRDRVLPSTLSALQTAIFLAVLYLTFGRHP